MPLRFPLAILFAAPMYVTLAPPSGALAQSPPDGVWWSLSAAAASARLACDICDPTRDAGPAVEGAVGTYATPSLRVGVDGGAWTFRDGDFRETVLTAGVVAELHPRPGSGLHLIGGLGWSGYRANDTDPGPDQVGFRYDALRLRLGAGWDLPLTPSWSVGNRVTLDASSLGTLKDEDTPIARSVGLSLARFAVYVRHR
jgi:hypothetical protein